MWLVNSSLEAREETIYSQNYIIDHNLDNDTPDFDNDVTDNNNGNHDNDDKILDSIFSGRIILLKFGKHMWNKVLRQSFFFI